MSSGSTAGQMRAAAMALAGLLEGEQRSLAARPFDDDAARKWLEYRPSPRPGASLALMSPAGRKAAHRLLSAGLSEHAYGQAMVITALEEVLDRQESGYLGRRSDDYWVCVFGDPAGDGAWSWRFEGHHLSVTMTIAGEDVSPAPVFFGANPARVAYAGRAVSRPLAPEEDLARDLLEALGPAGRAAAVVADQAPGDIRSSVRPAAGEPLEPLGVSGADMRATARALLGQLAALYTDRLSPELAAREGARVGAGDLHFAWEGPIRPGGRHYYRVQGEDLLIEYDNTDEGGNHAHSVFRRPRSDFGADILAAHYRQAHAR
jgi:Protein of unknown function (DUF3500)